MWVGTVTFIPVLNYLRGLRDGWSFSGIDYSWEHYLAAAESRGWDPRGNIGIERDFIREGLSDEEMARELIAVEIEAYRRAMADENERLKRNTKR
jgi:hypothetical protein